MSETKDTMLEFCQELIDRVHELEIRLIDDRAKIYELENKLNVQYKEMLQAIGEEKARPIQENIEARDKEMAKMKMASTREYKEAMAKLTPEQLHASGQTQSEQGKRYNESCRELVILRPELDEWIVYVATDLQRNGLRAILDKERYVARYSGTKDRFRVCLSALTTVVKMKALKRKIIALGEGV